MVRVQDVSKDLKLSFNYGTDPESGKIKRRFKSYKNIDKTATPEKIVATAGAIDTLNVPTLEQTYSVFTQEYIDIG